MYQLVQRLSRKPFFRTGFDDNLQHRIGSGRLVSRAHCGLAKVTYGLVLVIDGRKRVIDQITVLVDEIASPIGFPVLIGVRSDSMEIRNSGKYGTVQSLI